MVFERTVNCWFCNCESKVSVFKTNSWTCKSCDQYNGFKRDGDYNKSIHEMHEDTTAMKPKFCHSQSNNNLSAAASGGSGSTNIFCDKCNRNQEIKVEKLSKFEAKNEKNFDQEYDEYKTKMEQLYDLCKTCKNKLKLHLANLDRAIGRSNSMQQIAQPPMPTKYSTIMKPFNNVTNMVINGCTSIKQNFQQQYQQQYQQHKQALVENTNNFNMNKIKFSKAHTIAGTVPPYTFDRQSSLQNALQNEQEPTSQVNTNKPVKPARYDYENKDINDFVHKKQRTEASLKKLIAVEIFVFLCISLAFLGNLANLLHDGGSMKLNESNMLLTVYKYSSYLFCVATFLSLVLFILRPRISRISVISGIIFCTLVQSHLICLQRDEEQYALEFLGSLVLTIFLSIARMYNAIQLFAYYKNRCQTRSATVDLNQTADETKHEESINESPLRQPKKQVYQPSIQIQQPPVQPQMFGENLNRVNLKFNFEHNSSPAKFQSYENFQHTPKRTSSIIQISASNESPMQVDVSMNENDHEMQQDYQPLLQQPQHHNLLRRQPLLNSNLL